MIAENTFFSTYLSLLTIIILIGVLVFGIIFNIIKKQLGVVIILVLFLLGVSYPFLTAFAKYAQSIFNNVVSSDTLLQVDATVIAGILILLTITRFTKTSLSFDKTAKNKVKRFFVKILEATYFKISPEHGVSLVVAPFSVSAIIILLENNANSIYKGILNLQFASFWSSVGFAWLILVVVTLKFSIDYDENISSSSSNTHSE